MRCYDGCPDAELQALIDARAAARAKLRAAFPAARCVYYPVEQAFLIFQDNCQVGTFQRSEIFACDEGIRLLSKSA